MYRENVKTHSYVIINGGNLSEVVASVDVVDSSEPRDEFGFGLNRSVNARVGQVQEERLRFKFLFLDNLKRDILKSIDLLLKNDSIKKKKARSVFKTVKHCTSNVKKHVFKMETLFQKKLITSQPKINIVRQYHKRSAI